MADSLSLPSLLVLALILVLTVRYFYARPRGAAASASSSTPSRSAASTRSRVDTAKVEQVAQMFPQLDRRAIAWDLGRNGGNVGATAEKVLVGGGLENVRTLPFPT